MGDESQKKTRVVFERVNGVEIDPMTALTLGQQEQGRDIAEMKADIKELLNRPCPSPLCQECNKRLGRLEDHEKIIVGVVSIGVLGSGVLVYVLIKMFGS